jgi:hypothetical protein
MYTVRVRVEMIIDACPSNGEVRISIKEGEMREKD